MPVLSSGIFEILAPNFKTLVSNSIEKSLFGIITTTQNFPTVF